MDENRVPTHDKINLKLELKKVFSNSEKNPEVDNPSRETEQAAILLENLYGRQFFKKGVEELKEGDPNGAGMGRYGYPAAIPPLAYLWYRAREELIFGELTGEFKAGYASARLRALGGDLDLLKNIRGIEKVLEQLKKIETFELACFALSVAAGYRRKDIPVLFFKKNNNAQFICFSITPGNTPLTVWCGQWENLPGLDPKSRFFDDELFSGTKPAVNAPVLLYLNVVENRLTPNFDQTAISGAISGWLDKTGNPVQAVILSHGLLRSGRRGLTFTRPSLLLTKPDCPGITVHDIYLSS